MLNTISFKHNTTQILNILKNEVVFSLALILAIITSFFSFPKIEYIDFKVLFTLFNLMIIVGAFKDMKALDKIAIRLLTKFNNSRKISFILIFLTFFSSMLIIYILTTCCLGGTILCLQYHYYNLYLIWKNYYMFEGVNLSKV
ncbi:SLC13 family permease [Clostridium tagluense]|uniref:SLC13 family permease n=1 Tax=Clostridium tagluense TaxID=360422 RepID=UPI0034E25788